MYLKCLGGLELIGTTGAPVSIKPLLLLLYIRLKGKQDRNHLEDLFWGNNPKKTKKQEQNSLRTALRTLRKASPDLVNKKDSPVSSEVDLDILDLFKAVKNGDHSEVLKLHTGGFLEGVKLSGIKPEFEEWVIEQRDNLASQVKLHFLQHAERVLSESMFDEARTLAEDILKHYETWQLDIPDLRRLYRLLQRTQSSQVEKVGRILKEDLGSSEEVDYEAFEQRYLKTLTLVLQTPDPNGLSSENLEHPIPLSVGFVSALVSYGDTAATAARTERIHDVLPKLNPRRLLLRGEAGSGKTMLFNWFAYYLALGKFPTNFEQLDKSFKGMIPFIIRLRNFNDQSLPNLENLHYLVSARLSEPMPPGFIQRLMEEERLLLLVDGIDEIANSKRPDVINWLAELVQPYPGLAVCVSARTEAAPKGWLNMKGFSDALLLPLELDDVRLFVSQWFEAVANQTSITKRQGVLANAEELMVKVAEKPELQQLMQRPLLCAIICTLYHLHQELPPDRLGLYALICEVLVATRDAQRGIRGDIDKDQRVALMERLAFWMLLNGSEGSGLFSIAANQLKDILFRIWRQMNDKTTLTAETLHTEVLERFGVLRPSAELEGHFEFIHRSIAEFLAGCCCVNGVWGGIAGLLAKNAHNDMYRETIRFASANAEQKEPLFCQELLELLLQRTKEVGEHKRHLSLLAVSLCESSLMLPKHESVRELVDKILPLQSTSEARTLGAFGAQAAPHLPYDPTWSRSEVGYAIQALGTMKSVDVLPTLKDYAVYQPTDGLDMAEPVLNALIIVQAISKSEPIRQEAQALFRTMGKGIKHLAIAHASQVLDLSILAELQQLSQLVLYDMLHLRDVEMLKHLPNLQGLRLDNLPKVNSLDVLASLKRLHTLELYNMPQITNISVLSRLKSLRHLLFYDLVKLESLEALKGSSLKSLRLDRTLRVGNFEFLKELPELRTLDLINMVHLESLDFLEGLPYLENLEISYAPKLRSLEVLRSIKHLKSLRITHLPAIEDINHIGLLGSKVKLDLQNVGDLKNSFDL